MGNFAALTKIIMAVLISIYALLTEQIPVLTLLFCLEILVMALSGNANKMAKAVAMLLVFSIILFGIQLLCGTSLALSILSGLRMAIMSFAVMLMLATTKTQQITAALVKQCHMPYSYAFMVTAVLRFVPDLLAESQSVREAQACRGYKPSGNPFKRILGYMMIIKPMVFRAIARSGHMAMSLEMRGFSLAGKRTFLAETKLGGIDYIALGAAAIVGAMILQ